MKVNGLKLLAPAPSTLVPAVPNATKLPDHMTPALQTLHHFDTITYCSMGSDMGQQIIRSYMYHIALEKPYLMHAVNGVSAAHICHLLPAVQHPAQHRQSKLAAAYHWHEALRQFRDE